MGEAENRQASGLSLKSPPTPADYGVLATRDAAGTYRPFPILGHDLDLSTAIREVKGLLEYHVTVSNRDKRPIDHLVLTPALSDELKLADEGSKRIASIPPGETAVVKFKLSISEDARSIGIKGRPLPGLDFGVQTSLRVRKGAAKYDVTLENLHEWTIRRIRVEAKLPYGVVPLEPEREIEALHSGEKLTIAFALISQEEVDRKVRHEQRLHAAVLTPEESPRLSDRRFPREHTAEEIGEIVHWLEELQTLKEAGAAETMMEDLVEFGPTEFPLEILRVADPIEIGPVEERFALVDYDSEFKPMPPARPVPVPFEFTEALEEDFIHIDEDEFASIKPLGLEPTIAEEIEIEPMEMDL